MIFDVDKWMHSHAVPNKGTKHPWVARKMADAMVQSGFPKIIVKPTTKPAVLEVKRAATCLAREGIPIEVVLEESNEFVRQTRGFVEQVVQAVERKVHTLKFSVEELLGVTLLPNHPLLVWAVEYASQITNRSHRYTGETRSREKVCRTFEAIIVGLVERSDMVIVMHPRRLSESQRKDGDMVMALRGLPCRPKPDEPALDEVPVRVSVELKVAWQNLPDAPNPMASEVERRRVCSSARRRNYESMGTLKVAFIAQQPRQDRRRKSTAMLVDNVLKKRCNQKMKAERG